MFQLQTPAYREKVHGCWLGKSIGGTLGAPFEGSTETNDLTFYDQKDLGGSPAPNDDLDLQLLWLALGEFHGLDKLTGRMLGEYWINCITGPWCEYANCRWNCRSGFFPPLSGVCNNDDWKNSNGAWIRSEIWACLFPGNPDAAIRFAYMDASCDHAGEGVWAELFTCAMESAAFAVGDVRELIEIGLSKIPVHCRLRESVELVCQSFDAGEDWLTTRNKVVELNADMGFFQAPANVAFVIIGLLYGRGDFSETVCRAVNCGDDTDCTGATVGSIMGILQGASGIPKKWITPIGNRIVTCALDLFSFPVKIPATVEELTERTCKLAELNRAMDPLSAKISEDLKSTKVAEELHERSPYQLEFELPFAAITVEYLEQPYLKPRRSCPVRLWVRRSIQAIGEVKFRWNLPEGWESPAQEVRLGCRNFCMSSVDTSVVPPETLSDSMYYLELDVNCDDRSYPTTIRVPFRQHNLTVYPNFKERVDPSAMRFYTTVANRVRPQ